MNGCEKIKAMKILRNIFTNPFAIATVLVHWLVVSFSLLFEETQVFRNSYTFGLPEPQLFNWLLYLNTPSGLFIEFIVHPILSLFGRNLLTESLGILILICCVTFQWLLFGYLINLLCIKFKPEEIKFSLD